LLAELMACDDRDRHHRQQAARQALVLWRWIGSEETHCLEEDLRVSAARLAALGEVAGWLVETLSEIGAEAGWPLAQCERLRNHAARLSLGLPAAGLALGRLRVPGLGRDGVRQLVAAGYATPADLSEASPAQLEGLVGPRLAADLQRLCSGQVAPARAAASPSRPAPQPPLPTAAVADPAADTRRAVLTLDEGRPDEAEFYGHRVALRPAEFRLLRVLARAAGRCVRYDALYDDMWQGDRFVEPGQIYSHRSRLSAKLAQAAPDHDVKAILVTVPKHGLRLNLTPEEVCIAS